MTDRLSTTHGGRSRRFNWSVESDQVLIENEMSRRHSFSLLEIDGLLHDLQMQFDADWFPLANNVEKMYHNNEIPGLGSDIYARSPGDTLHAQGASYLGVVLEEAGILEWNGRIRGIKWRIVDLPPDLATLRQRLATAAGGQVSADSVTGDAR